MQKSYKSIRVFKNSYLEKLTHVHPITPLVVWVPIAGWLTWRSFDLYHLSATSVGILGAGGFFTWTLLEYLLHRFVFHFEGEGPIVQRLHFLVHGLHHVDPVDPTRLVMPPSASLVLGAFVYALFRYILGSIWVEPFFAFMIVGYLCYDYIHYSVHHFTPRTKFGKLLKQSHMQHHYVNPNSRWGVSSPFWDYVFGTLEGVKDKQQAI